MIADADHLAATGGRYLIISSDCHAGLPNAEYRDWLDPEHLPAFDAYLAERTRMLELAQRGMLNATFAEESERDNAEGSAAAGTPPAATPSSTPTGWWAR